MIELIAVGFIILHDLHGLEVAINPEQITSIMRTRADGEGKKLLHDKVECVIGFTNGKFQSVVEGCDEVLRKIVDAEREKP